MNWSDAYLTHKLISEWSNNTARLFLYMLPAVCNTRRTGLEGSVGELPWLLSWRQGTRWGPTEVCCPKCCYKCSHCLDISWHWPMEQESFPNPIIFCCVLDSSILVLSLIDLADNRLLSSSKQWLQRLSPCLLFFFPFFLLFLFQTNKPTRQLDLPTMLSSPLVILASTRWAVGVHKKKKKGFWRPNECLGC